VLDNADDLTVLNQYWPATEHGAVIITSQNPASEGTLAHRGAEILPFLPIEGNKFFHSLLPLKLSTEEEEAVAEIVDALGCHPLAINQMASFIRESKCSVSALQEMHTRRKEALELQQVDYTSLWSTHTVAVTFDIAIEKLNSAAHLTLEFLSFFDPDRIPEDLLWDKAAKIPSLSTTVSRHVIIKELRTFTLINKNTHDRTISLHRLVRDAALRRLNSHYERKQSAFENAVHLLRHAFPLHGIARDHMTEVWDQCEIYLPHVLALHERYVEMIDGRPPTVTIEFIELIYSCAW